VGRVLSRSAGMSSGEWGVGIVVVVVVVVSVGINFILISYRT